MSVSSGYTRGDVVDPTYEEVCTSLTGHGKYPVCPPPRRSTYCGH
ncbi:MAG: peptide-methionine (S)-S-oxide reductase [Chlamydiia bacterium]